MDRREFATLLPVLLACSSALPEIAEHRAICLFSNQVSFLPSRRNREA